MAGSNPAFNAATFRTAIRDTMLMAFPGATAEQPTFRWNTDRTYTRPDSGGHPFTWGDTPVTEVETPDQVVRCAVEFQQRATLEGTPAGVYDTSRAVLTLLDTDYVLIEGADQVLLGGNVYDIVFTEPPLGLFDVTVYRVHAHARDES